MSFVVDVEQTSRLILVSMNAHSRVAAAAELTLRRPVYSDAAVKTSRGRLLLAKAHIRQSILSSVEAMKIVTERHELEELRSLLQKVHDRSLRKFSELELEDNFTELRLAPDVCARTKLHVEPIPPDFVQYKVDDLFYQYFLPVFSTKCKVPTIVGTLRICDLIHDLNKRKRGSKGLNIHLLATVHTRNQPKTFT